MTAQTAYWQQELPDVCKELYEAGYLRPCKPLGTTLEVEGFLDFDEKAISNGWLAGDPLARVAAVGHALLPWIECDTSEVASQVALAFAILGESKKTGEVVCKWLVQEWNPARLAKASGWPEYELGQHLVDIDVVLGHRKADPSPFIGHAIEVTITDGSDFNEILPDIAGALFQLEADGAAWYAGPVLWTERGSEFMDGKVSLYLTPFDIFGGAYVEQFLAQLAKVKRLAVIAVTEKTYLSGNEVPLFGLEEDEEFRTVVLRFLATYWWKDAVFGSTAPFLKSEAAFPLRVPLHCKTHRLTSQAFGPFSVTSALHWFGTPEQHLAMLSDY